MKKESVSVLHISSMMHLISLMLYIVELYVKSISLVFLSSILSNVRLFKDSLVKIIGDIFDSYDSLINLFGGQCQII
ncbi:MAG: hypothetical protein SPG41_01060 [Erysipelotrichaceae bacterium]|nr:hypothetical protein [Erysipelotrichaceae bacterium]